MTALRQNKTLLAAAGALLVATALAEPPYCDFELVGVLSGGYWAVPAAAGTGALALCSPVGRRFIVLLSSPAVAFLLRKFSNGGPWSNYAPTILLPIVPIAFAVFIISAVSLGPAERIVRHIRRGGW